MSNCPICGSQGDDLIFKFYCSNRECANFISSSDIISSLLDYNLPKTSMVESQSVQDLQAYKEGWVLSSLSNLPPFPNFVLTFDPVYTSLGFLWVDSKEVPLFLNENVENILLRYIGTPMSCQLESIIRAEIILYLTSLVARGDLYWNSIWKRWELGFSKG